MQVSVIGKTNNIVIEKAVDFVIHKDNFSGTAPLTELYLTIVV